MYPKTDTITVAAIGDIHCTRNSQGLLSPIFRRMREVCDIVVLCGDLTDYGLPEEAKILAEELAPILPLPIVGVLGNHDYESGHHVEVKKILCDAGVTILDGDSCVIKGVGFAGVKGFAGGFGDHSLEAWGEGMMKSFVQETVNEALKLETALSRLHAERRIAVLHYSPIQETIEGEAAEIKAFLGSRRLEEPLVRFPVDCVFHGHAHKGQPEGITKNGIPVFNVAMPMLKRRMSEESPFRLFSVSLSSPTPAH